MPKLKLPPGPKHLIGLKFANEFKENTLEFLLKLHKEYGEVVYARMGPYRAYFFSSPETVKEILVQKVKQLPKFHLQVKVLSQWDGNGLVLSEGEFWQKQHKLVQPAFQTKRFEGYTSAMSEKTKELNQKWQAYTTDTIFDIEEEMTGLTLSIITKTLFGKDLSNETKDLGKAVKILSETAVREMGEIVHFPDWIPLKKNREKTWAIHYLNKFILSVLEERRKSGIDAGDLLSMLLPMENTVARDEAMVLFLAGHDTTASGLTWLWYVLAQYPDVQKKVQVELDQVLKGNTVRFADTQKLPYLNAVIKETLRLFPPAVGVFAREAMEDLEIGGYSVPKKSIIYIFSYVTHRDSKWFKEPEKFNPDRFLIENENQISPFVYFPFGVGPRACIGAQFAMTEMIIVASTILQQYTLSLAPGQEKTKPLALMSLRPEGGIKMTVKKR